MTALRQVVSKQFPLSRSAAIGLLLVLLGGSGASGAEAYRFSSVSEGAYPRKTEGRAIVDGNRWRIEFEVAPNDVVDLNAIVSTADGQLIAIDDAQKTWFRLASRTRLGIDRMLFTYFGENVKVSRLSVKATPLSDGDRANWRIEFSYRIATKVSGEPLRGRVEGSISIWTRPDPRSLPWSALDLHTGLLSVDEAMAAALGGIEGMIWQTETDVARQLENGAVLRSSIRRTIGDITPVAVSDETFRIPAGYVFREPVLGVPASNRSRSH